jgi:malate dehydrogenase (quinone)
VLQSPDDRLTALRAFMPTARMEDWDLAIAGQRVQIIKPDPRQGGKIEFGTEVVAAADGSLAALLGASPGASTAVVTMVDLIRRCFPDRAQSPAWRDVLGRVLPTLDQPLDSDPALLARVRGRTHEVLGLHE